MDTTDFSGFINEFLEEAEEHLHTLDSALLEIEQNAAGASKKDRIDSLFRAAHTVKGLAGMMEFEQIERICHKMEDLFGDIRQDKLTITQPVLDSLFAGVDMLGKLIASVKETGSDKGIPLEASLAAMDAARGGGTAIAPSSPPARQKSGAAPSTGSAKKKKTAATASAPPLNGLTLNEKETAILQKGIEAGLWIYEVGKEFAGGTPEEKLHRLPVFGEVEKAGLLIACIPPLDTVPSATGTVNTRLIFGSDMPPDAVREAFMDPVKILKEGTGIRKKRPETTSHPAAPALNNARPLDAVLAALDETLLQDFIKSAWETLNQIDLILLETERDPENHGLAAELHQWFRSYRGRAALFGFNKIALLAAKLEGLFEEVASGHTPASSALFETTALCVEKLKQLLEELKLRTDAGIGVEKDLKRVDALMGKPKRPNAAVKALIESSSLSPATAMMLTPEEMELIADAHEKGNSVFKVELAFSSEVIKDGYEPLSIVPVLEKCGEILVSIPQIEGVPELVRWNNQTWGIGFHFLVATAMPEHELQHRLSSLPSYVRTDVRGILHAERKPASAPPASPRTAAPAPKAAAAPPAPQIAEAPPARESALTAEAEKKMKEKAVNTIRVDIERLDKLLNLIGELVIDRTRLEQLTAEIRKRMPNDPVTVQLAHTNQLFQRHMNEIQDMVMSVRMVPIGNAFNKFPRIVRDLAKSLGKEVNLAISGESTELDKTLIEEVGDPLVHLIRNAIDHGIETPHERRAAGKPEAGTLSLKAFHEGDTIIIEVGDDGRGMNLDKIRSRAIERGLLDPADEAIAERDILQFIFEPGFSTTDSPTLVSGRGVGMDVVKKNIARLKGLIDIHSQPGKGSTIRLRLPLTLAIVPTLIVGVRQETFAIPLSSVAESIRVAPGDIRMMNGREMINLRDSVLPLARLDDLFLLDRKPLRNASTPAERSKENRRSLFIVVVGLAEKRLGLIVDDLKRQQEVVIKNLGEMLRDAPGISGATIMGDGRVALILDPSQIIEEASNRQRDRRAGLRRKEEA